MKHPRIIESQLKRSGCRLSFWNRAEVRELSNILWEDEEVTRAVSGMYENGVALLVSTNHRLLLVDRKPLGFLTVQDLRFEMITDFHYTHRFAMADVNVCTPHKELAFRSYNKPGLRQLLEFVQQRVISVRGQQGAASAPAYMTAEPAAPARVRNPMTSPISQQLANQGYWSGPQAAPQPASQTSAPVISDVPNVTLANNAYYQSYAEHKRELLIRLGAFTVSKLPGGFRVTPR